MSLAKSSALQAVIFDFDGVIVDSEPLHYRAFLEVLKPRGIEFSFDEYLDRYIGFDDRDAFKEAFKQMGKKLDGPELADLIVRKAKAFERIVKSEIKPFPGSVELIRDLSNEKIPLAIASGALKDEIELILGMLSLSSYFNVIVSADQVKKSKPDPETYIVALKELEQKLSAVKLDPGACIAIEDTPAGIASAQRAGLKVVAVGHSYQREDLVAADCAVENLNEITLSGLIDLVEGK